MALTQVPSVMIDRPLVTIASASTVNIGAAASDNISVTGTTTITAFDSIAAGAVRTVTFAGALTLTHNATTLILPGSANITTAAGDVATFISLGSGNWRCVTYTKASGQAVVSPPPPSDPTTAQVLTATAGATALAVGTYVFALSYAGAKANNTNYAGSSLYTVGLASTSNSSDPTVSEGVGSTLAGTWKCMSIFKAAYYNQGVTLFLRVA